MKSWDLGIDNILDSLAPGWNTKKIGEFIFDEQFQIEGVPLSWFYQRLLSLHTVPPQLQTRRKIEQFLAGKPLKYTLKDKLKNKLLCRAFFFNELAKMNVSKLINRDTSKRDILFLTYLEHLHPETGKVFRIEGIVSNLKRKRKTNHLILCVSPQSQSFLFFRSQKSRIKGGDFALIYNHITPEIRIKSEKLAQELYLRFETMKESTKNIFEAELWETIRGLFDFYFSKEFLYCTIVYYETYKSIIKKLGLKVIVITSQNSIFERCLNAAAHQFQCPVVLLQHGAAMGSINPQLLQPYTIAVFSKKYKQALQQQKVPAENIKIVGPIIFDEIYPFLGKITPPSLSPQILILTVPFVEQEIFTHQKFFSYVEKIIKESAAITNSTITLKLHPRERYRSDYEKLIQNLNLQKVTVIQNDQRAFLYQLMCRSDIIINFSSTSAIEGMILDKLLITITFPDFCNPFNEIISVSQATVEVSIQDHLTQTIQTLLNNTPLQEKLRQNRQKFVQDYCGHVDGKASEHMSMLLQKMAAENELKPHTFKNKPLLKNKNGKYQRSY